MSSAFPWQLARSMRKRERERGKEGVKRGEGGRGRASSEGGRQPTTTADSSRSAQEGGVGG